MFRGFFFFLRSALPKSVCSQSSVRNEAFVTCLSLVFLIIVIYCGIFKAKLHRLKNTYNARQRS